MPHQGVCRPALCFLVPHRWSACLKWWLRVEPRASYMPSTCAVIEPHPTQVCLTLCLYLYVCVCICLFFSVCICVCLSAFMVFPLCIYVLLVYFAQDLNQQSGQVLALWLGLRGSFSPPLSSLLLSLPPPILVHSFSVILLVT